MSIEEVLMRQDLSDMRLELSGRILNIGWDDYGDGIFGHVDSFVELSKGNNTVEDVRLNPYWYRDRIRQSYYTGAEWEEKLGRALGNLQSLKVLSISYGSRTKDYEEEYPPDWESIARVWRHIRQKSRCLWRT
jgi:hypothetical protein